MRTGMRTSASSQASWLPDLGAGLSLSLALLALACGQPTGDGHQYHPTDIGVQPALLTLAVGDTALAHAYLMEGPDRVPVGAPGLDIIRMCYSRDLGPSGEDCPWNGITTRLAHGPSIGESIDKYGVRVEIEGVAPGVDTLWIHYGHLPPAPLALVVSQYRAVP